MMIIVKLVLLERPLYNEHCIYITRIKNMFKQKNVFISEIYYKVLWLTETKSTMIKSTKLSKPGNPVHIILYYVLKQYTLPLYYLFLANGFYYSLFSFPRLCL